MRASVANKSRRRKGHFQSLLRRPKTALLPANAASNSISVFLLEYLSSLNLFYSDLPALRILKSPSTLKRCSCSQEKTDRWF